MRQAGENDQPSVSPTSADGSNEPSAMSEGIDGGNEPTVTSEETGTNGEPSLASADANGELSGTYFASEEIPNSVAADMEGSSNGKSGSGYTDMPGNHLSVSKTDTLKIQELVRETHKTTRC